MYSKLSALLTLVGVVAVNGTAAPDNFFFALEKDLKTFGVNRNRRKRNGPKVEEVKTPSSPSVHVDVDVDVDVDDDFNRAEGKFFHAVENIEKKAITVAHDLIHDEVDVLFGKDHGHHEQENSIEMDGDHGHDHAFHLPIFGGRRRGSASGSASSKKNHVHQVTSSTKINDTDNNEETDEKFLNFMENYAENCFNPHGGW